MYLRIQIRYFQHKISLATYTHLRSWRLVCLLSALYDSESGSDVRPTELPVWDQHEELRGLENQGRGNMMSSLFFNICFFNILSFQLHHVANKEIGRNLRLNLQQASGNFQSLLHIIWGDSPFKKKNFGTTMWHFFCKYHYPLSRIKHT